MVCVGWAIGFAQGAGSSSFRLPPQLALCSSPKKPIRPTFAATRQQQQPCRQHCAAARGSSPAGAWGRWQGCCADDLASRGLANYVVAQCRSSAFAGSRPAVAAFSSAQPRSGRGQLQVRSDGCEAMDAAWLAHCGWPLCRRRRRRAAAALPPAVPTTWPTDRCCLLLGYRPPRLWRQRASSACGLAATRARPRWCSSRWCAASAVVAFLVVGMHRGLRTAATAALLMHAAADNCERQLPWCISSGCLCRTCTAASSAGLLPLHGMCVGGAPALPQPSPALLLPAVTPPLWPCHPVGQRPASRVPPWLHACTCLHTVFCLLCSAGAPHAAGGP